MTRKKTTRTKRTTKPKKARPWNKKWRTALAAAGFVIPPQPQGPAPWGEKWQSALQASGFTKKPKVGRPPLKLDMKERDQLQSLAACGCTNDEIEAIMGHPYSTLYHNFGEVIKKGRDSRNGALRHKQFQVAIGGNVSMLIFLGKQYLGQSDKLDMPSLQALVEQYRNMTDEQRARRILEILKSEGAAPSERPDHSGQPGETEPPVH